MSADHCCTHPYSVAALRSQIVGIDQMVPLLDGTRRPYVYFDNAASTPAFARVQHKVDELLQWYSSVHRGAGLKSLVCTQAYDQAHEIVAHFVGADPARDCVVFGKNTTEAINKLANRMDLRAGDVVISTAMEHHSNDLPWRPRAQVEYVELCPDCSLDLGDLEAKLQQFAGRVRLVAATGASNVSGYLNPVHEIAALAHRYGAQVLIDCAQLAPHRKVDMGPADSAGHLDFVAISAHKMYAPFGTGALVGPRAFFEEGEPDYRGGGTIDVVTPTEVHWADAPDRDEAGTPNVIGAVALAASMTVLSEVGMDALAADEAELTAYALRRMQAIPGIQIYGPSDPDRADSRLGVIAFGVAGVHHAKAAAILGFEGGIGVRNGCFCAHPYVLRLLGISQAEFDAHKELVLHDDRSTIPGLLRVSFGCYNTLEEVDHLIVMLRRIVAGDYGGDYVVDKPSGSFYPAGFDMAQVQQYFTL